MPTTSQDEQRTLPKHQAAVHDNIKNFECDKCDYKSYSKQSLTDHIKYKHDKIARTTKVVTCQHCHKEVANLEWHVKKIHTLIRHKCNKCEKEYIAKHHLDEHVKSVHEEKKIECPKENCNFKAGILSRLKVHMKKVHCENKPSYPCPNCDHKSTEKSGLEKHIQYVHLKAPKASCDICGAVVRGDHLERHKKSVHYNPEHGVSCHRCGKMLKDEAGLRGHLKRHDNNDKGIDFKCEMCNLPFKSIFTKRKHYERDHLKLKENIEYSCIKCDYKSGSSSGLRNHEKRVHLGLRYPCGICEYKAGAKGDLKIHIQYTHKKMKLPCNLCDKEFSRPSGLLLHKQKVHQGIDKSFKCNMCEKVLSAKFKLQRHINSVHLKIKFKCELCDYRGCKEALVTHTKAQHGNERFKCDYCSHEAKYKNNLTKHIRESHIGPDLKCERCAYTTKSKQQLKIHCKVKHANTESEEIGRVEIKDI